MILEAGSTFHNQSTGNVRSHLWIVASCPSTEPERIVIVNLTSQDGSKDNTCRLDAGDHPFVRHPSVVYYQKSTLTTLEKLSQGFESGLLGTDTPMDPVIMRRIWDGFAVSRVVSRDIKALLRQQGYIE